MSISFDLLTPTKIESGTPIAMHAQVGNAIAGNQFQLDVREYRWEETVVSSGITDCAHILSSFPTGRSHSTFCRGGRSRPIPLGNIVLIPPNIEVTIQSPAGYQRFLSLMIDPAMAPILSSIEWSPALLERALNIRHPRIRGLMSSMAAEITHPSFGSKVMIEGTALVLAVELCRFFGTGRDAEKNTYRLSKRQLRLVTEQIDAQQCAPSLAELASSCGMSRRHLTRSFKQTTGITIGEFIRDRQIAQAKELLAQEDLLIKQIAYRCGFTSTAAFAAAFRHATGRAPSEFRRGIADELLTDA